MRLLYIYQYYNSPDCAANARHHRYIRDLAQRHQITLVTTDHYYGRRLTDDFEWVPANVNLVSFKVPYRNELDVASRGRAYGDFALRALGTGFRSKPHVVFATSTPLTVGWAGHRIARWKGVPWVFEVRDLWPDFPVQMGALRSAFMRKQAYRLEEKLYRSAARVVTLSPDMEKHVLSKGAAADSVTTIWHGTDFDLIDKCTEGTMAALRREHGLAGKRVILYAGTLGLANDIPTVIEAAERLADRKDIAFVIAGSGRFEPVVAQAAATRSNIIMLPPTARSRMLCWHRLADLSLVTFRDLPVLASNSPAKFFDSLGAGTPVIVTNPGWSMDFVQRHNCGWYVAASNPTELAASIAARVDDPTRLTEAGKNGQAIARQQFDRATLVREFEAVLIAASGRRETERPQAHAQAHLQRLGKRDRPGPGS